MSTWGTLKKSLADIGPFPFLPHTLDVDQAPQNVVVRVKIGNSIVEERKERFEIRRSLLP